MATILDAELPSHDEEDVEFTAPEGDSQDSQDSQDLEEEASCNADQIPVGKIQFPLKKKNADGEDETTGEAFVFGDEDVKVTTINELECGDTIDEDDCTFNCEDEEPSQDNDEGDEDNEGKEKEGEEEADSQDPDDEDELEADADPEDLKNFEVVCRPSTKGTDNELLKMKFKDVESWKAQNQNADNMDEDDSQPEAEGEGEAEAPAEGQAEGEAEAEPEEAEALSKICESYNEEADEDYNPIYNEDTLSDIECPEDVDQEDDEDLKVPEVVTTEDDFCMIKQDIPLVRQISQESREEMECC